MTNPEDDPAGFQALRAAYERALAYAGPSPTRKVATPTVEAEIEPRPQPRFEPGSEPDAEPPPEEAAKERSRDWRPPDVAQSPEPRSRDWRAPEDARAVQPPLRPPPAWRPADPPVRIEAFDEAVRRGYADRRAALSRLVADPAAQPEALQAALQALLASPMLEEMARHAEAERWLAALIAGASPRSDPLIDPAIAYFGWDERRVGPRSTVGARVLARRDDLRFLVGCRYAGAKHRGALEALTARPVGWRWLLNRITPDLGRRVGELVGVIRGQRPGLTPSLDREALDWWEVYTSRPRLGPIAIWALVAAPLLAALAVLDQSQRSGGDLFGPPIAAVVAFAAVTAVVSLKLFAIDWPRARWRAGWSARAPGWVRLGWAPGLLALLILAAIVPGSVLAAAGLAIAALALTLWALVVGEPDRRQFGQPIPSFRWRGPIISFPIAFAVYLAYWGLLRPGVRFSWQVRTVFAFAYLAAFWLAAADDLAPVAVLQMTGPLIAAAIGFSVGAGSLAAAWGRLSKRARLGWLVGLAGLIAASLASLWLAGDFVAVRPFAAALIVAAVFAHRAPASGLGVEGYTARDLVMRYGWLGLGWVAVNLADLSADRVSALVIFAIAALVALIVAVERTGHAAGGGFGQRLARIGAAALRYGWIALAPVVLVLGAGRDVTALFTAGLWLLCGVGVTAVAYVPAWRRRESNNG